MSRPLFSDRASTDEHQDEQAQLPKAADHLHRLAKLVANGEAAVPTDLDPEALRTLLSEVAGRRKARLVRYVARAIAADILRSREP